MVSCYYTFFSPEELRPRGVRDLLLIPQKVRKQKLDPGSPSPLLRVLSAYHVEEVRILYQDLGGVTRNNSLLLIVSAFTPYTT